VAAVRPETPRRIANRERLIFALDVPDLAGAKKLVERLGDSVVFYKIGLELATSRHYFELLDWLLAQDKKVFADLKLYDIPATVMAAADQWRSASPCSLPPRRVARWRAASGR